MNYNPHCGAEKFGMEGLSADRICKGRISETRVVTADEKKEEKERRMTT